MLRTAEARGPGTYRFSAQNISRQGAATGDSDAAALEMTATVDYSVHSVDDFTNKIASKEYLEELSNACPLPDATGPEWWNYLRHDVFSTYRRLFVLVLLANFIALLYCIWMSTEVPGLISNNDAATAVGANLFIGTLMRHEHCVNLLFRVFVAIPRCTPVSLRRLAAKVYSYGGIHSACGISGLAWYIVFMVLFIARIFDQISYPYSANVVSMGALSGLMFLLLAVLIIMSHPKIRAKFHDQWELCHRYCGWGSIAVIWVQIILIACSNAETLGWSVGYTLCITPAFWFLIGVTALIVYPWLRLRRVRYSAEKLSSHAIRLWFNEEKRVLPTTVGVKLSTSPLTENHSFATIPNTSNRAGYSVLVSNNGDWTKQLITNPPEYLWTRGAYTIGVMRVALLFKPLVIVATGSGIGPCLSFLQVYPDWPCRVVWSARFPEATYGKDVLASVFRADGDAVVIDTKKTGKPDLVRIVLAVHEEMKAEAVVVISNPPCTREVVYRLETRKIPAFGAIFDS